MHMPGGRPPKWNSPDEVQKLIDVYFASFKEGAENYGKPITITGLALALDTNRETLCSYGEKDEYSDTIKIAKARVEHYAEQRLFDGAATGPIFALKNYGWKDTQDVNHGGQKDNPVVTTLADADKEILKRYFSENKVE